MHDVDKLKKALAFVLHLANKIDEVTQDGFSWISDSIALLPNLIEVPSIIKDGKELWGELNDLDEAELAELQQFAKDEFDIDDEELEGVVEAAFDLLFSAGTFYEKAKAALKKE